MNEDRATIALQVMTEHIAVILRDIAEKHMWARSPLMVVMRDE